MMKTQFGAIGDSYRDQFDSKVRWGKRIAKTLVAVGRQVKRASCEGEIACGFWLLSKGHCIQDKSGQKNSA